MSSAVGSVAVINNLQANTFDDIIDGIKNGAQWLGRHIQTGWNNYIVPGIKVLWAFFKTGFGLAVLAATAGITILAILQKKPDEDSCLNHLGVRIALNITAIVCLVAAGAFLVVGSAVLL